MDNKKDKTPKYGTPIISNAVTGDSQAMEDKKDKTPKYGTEIIPGFIKKVERTEEKIDTTTPSITGNSQAADLGQPPVLNWKKGYNRLATVLHPNSAACALSNLELPGSWTRKSSDHPA